MFEPACEPASKQSKFSPCVGRWGESTSDLEIEVVVEDQDRRGGRWMDGCLGEACDVCGAFAITGSLVFISVRCAGQEKIHAPGSTQLKRTRRAGWEVSLCPSHTVHSQPVNWFPQIGKILPFLLEIPRGLRSHGTMGRVKLGSPSFHLTSCSTVHI